MNFYKTKQWKEKRAYILKRDKYLCQDCRKYGKRKEAETVHHVIPYEVAQDLALQNKNLISLCSACHNKRHHEKAKSTKDSPPRYYNNQLMNRERRGGAFPTL